ncbi:MAG: hypothetical protein M0Q15_19230, partial [Nevskia sp.]|nr:hypothetical protein [Nevskia sp.]
MLLSEFAVPRGGFAAFSLFSMRVLRLLAVLVGVCSVTLSGVAQAQAMSEADEAAARIKMAQTLGPLGPNLFGDTVNMSTGEVTFATTDVSLPGNNGLAVALGRRWTVTGRSTEVPELPDDQDRDADPARQREHPLHLRHSLLPRRRQNDPRRTVFT